MRQKPDKELQLLKVEVDRLKSELRATQGRPIRNFLMVIGMAILLIPVAAMGVASVPYIFVKDTEISAAKLDANFKALVKYISSLESQLNQVNQQVSQLQSSVASASSSTASTVTLTNLSMTDYLNNWDTVLDGQCPQNKVLVGLYSYHDNGHEDRRWRLKCAQLTVQ